jgi:hypothetical protein
MNSPDSPAVTARIIPLATGSSIGPIFHQPWWLEAVAPGRWGEAVVKNEGEVVARLPYIQSRGLLGGKLLGSGPLTKYLGPYYKIKSEKTERRLSKELVLFEELHNELGPYAWLSQNFHFDQQNWYPAKITGLKVEPQLTYLIDKGIEESLVWDGLHERLRRNVRKAAKQVQLVMDDNIEEVHRLVELTFERQGRNAPVSYALFVRLFEAARSRNQATTLLARDKKGRNHAGLFIVWDNATMYYLAGGADPELRQSGAMPMLLWESIRLSRLWNLNFDFEGSMVPAIEHFFRAFGGRQQSYFKISGGSIKYAAIKMLYGPRKGQ